MSKETEAIYNLMNTTTPHLRSNDPYQEVHEGYAYFEYELSEAWKAASHAICIAEKGWEIADSLIYSGVPLH